MDAFVYLQSFETIGGAVLTAGSVVLMLMLVAMGTYAYKQIKGDGVTWPDEKDSGPGPEPESVQGGDREATGTSSLEKGDEDDEWDYY